jgi:hypothetical protein
LFNRFDVAGIGDHHGHLPKLFQNSGHSFTLLAPLRFQNTKGEIKRRALH